MNTYEANAVMVMPHEQYMYNFVQGKFHF